MNNNERFDPTWKYLASSINWDVLNTNRYKEIVGEEPYKILEGKKISAIISMAAVIEGCLRTYLVFRILNTRAEQARIEKILKDYDEGKIKVLEIPSLYEPIENYEKQLQEINTTISKFNKKTQIRNIYSEEWGSLKIIFDQIHNETFSTCLSEVNENLKNDLENLFLYRHFFVHSNMIQAKMDEDLTEFLGSTKILNDYLISINIKNESIKLESFFIEELMPENLIQHFQKTMNSFFELKVFKEIPNMMNQINWVYKRL